jgi:hypothetical protein
VKLIYLEWEDAIANGAWFTLEETRYWADNASMLIQQVGWVYEETDRHILLVSRLCPTEKTLGSIQKIPKTWIRKRINLTKYIKDKK